MVFYRINDNVTEPLDAIFGQGEKQGQAKAKLIGGTFAAPGHSEFQVARLEAGRYAAVCFIPVRDDAKGPLHLSKGELAEFRVT